MAITPLRITAPERITESERITAPGEAGDPPHLDGHVLVGFGPEVGRLEQAEALARVGARALARSGETTVAALPAGVDAEDAAAGLARARGVAFAEPDHLRAKHACGDCWYLDPAAGPQPGAGVRDLHAAGVTGEGTTVAVLDTGVGGVPDLDGQVLSRRACALRCGQAGPPAGTHGTLVASLIAAKDDDLGVTGVAPGAKIRSWQVDAGEGIATSAVVAALEEVAADPEISVVNMSFGGIGRSEAERAAVARVQAAGKVVVASSGNDGSYVPQYPAAYTGVLSVGAAGPDGGVAEFTSYGKLDLVAPGACLPATGSDGSSGMARCPEPERAGTRYVTGTSFAAPVVSGVLALRRAGTPLRSRLGLLGTAGAEPPPGLDDPKRWGHGRVDAAAWAASFAAGAAPYLVAEAADQLPYPGGSDPTTWHAYLLRSAGPLADAPGDAAFTGLTAGEAPFTEAEPGVLVATLPSGPLEPGTGVEEVSVASPSGTLRAAAAARVLRPDDQAPGVALPGPAPWRVTDSLRGGGTGRTRDHDVDDVYAVELAAGATLDAALRVPAGGGLEMVLFPPGATDVFGETDRIAADGTAPGEQGVARLTHTAREAGTYLLDVYAPGLEPGPPAQGDYTLEVTTHESTGVAFDRLAPYDGRRPNLPAKGAR